MNWNEKKASNRLYELATTRSQYVLNDRVIFKKTLAVTYTLNASAVVIHLQANVIIITMASGDRYWTVNVCVCVCVRVRTHAFFVSPPKSRSCIFIGQYAQFAHSYCQGQAIIHIRIKPMLLHKIYTIRIYTLFLLRIK